MQFLCLRLAWVQLIQKRELTQQTTGGGQTELTPSIVLDQTSITLSDAIPLVSTAQIKATVSNANGANIKWISDSKSAYSVSEDSNSYATLTALLGGTGKITAGIVVNEKAYKASADVSVNLATAASSNISVNEDTSSTAEHEFKVTWENPSSSSSSSENLSVKNYIAALYKLDGENENLIAFSKLDSSATEKSFSSETSENYSIENYSIDSSTTYKVKLYCIYTISSSSTQGEESSEKTSTTTYSVNEKEITTKADNSDPEPVSDAIMALAEDSSSITLSWTNSIDTDLASFKITPYIDETAQDVISLLKADSETNKIDFSSSAKNSYTYNLTSQKDAKTYKFTITAYDDAQNPKSLEGENSKYVVSFLTSETESSITVEGDKNPPAKVGNLAITIKSISGDTVTYDASWTNPTDSDFDKVLINGEDVNGVISFQNHTLALSALSDGFTVSSVDTVGNEATITIPKVLFANLTLNSNIKDEAFLSKALLISDISISDSSSSADYSTVYSVSAIKSDDTEKNIVSSANVSDGKAVLRGLECDTKYSLIAGATYTSSDYTLSFTDKDSSAVDCSSVPSLVVWEIHSPWQGSGLITPYMTSSKSNQNVVQAGFADTTYSNIEDFTYNAWIVQPALNGDLDSFSLEATVANTGASSGYYMTSGSSSKYSAADWDVTGKASSWGYNASSYSYHAWVTNDFDDEDKDLMSFKKSENSDYSGTGYYWITLDKNDYVLYGSTANMAFVSKPTSYKKDSEKGDYAFSIVEHKFTGTNSAPSQVVHTEEKTATTASITFTIADSDIASYKVSTTNKNANGETIADVEKSSKLGLMGSHTVSYTGLSRNTTYTFTITVTDAEGLSSDTSVSLTTDNSYAATNVTLAPRYTGELLVTWEEDSEATDATYTVKVYESGSSEAKKTVSDIASGTKYALIRDLTVGTSYTADVVCNYSSTDYTASSASSATVVKVTAILQGRNGARYMIPSVEDGSIVINMASSSSANDNYSATWIVHSALDNTLTFTHGSNSSATNTFSLEATDASGKATNTYLYLPTLTSGNTNSAGYAAEATLVKSPEDASHSSFFLATASSTSGNYTKCIRLTNGTGGFMLANSLSTTGASGNYLGYRYSAGSPGYSNWHWYMNTTTTSE